MEDVYDGDGRRLGSQTDPTCESSTATCFDSHFDDSDSLPNVNGLQDNSDSEGDTLDSDTTNSTFPFECVCGAMIQSEAVRQPHLDGRGHAKFMKKLETDQSEASTRSAKSESVPRRIHMTYKYIVCVKVLSSSDTYGIRLCIKYHIPFSVDDTRGTKLANPHPAAETCRWAIRSKEAALAVKEMNRRQGYGLTVLFPSDSELEAFRRLIVLEDAENPIPAVFGYRRVMKPDDVARGRSIYQTSLHQSRVCIINDSIYYFTPTELVALFVREKCAALELGAEGLVIYSSARHFSDKEGSLLIDRFRQEERKPQSYNVCMPTFEPVIGPDGNPVLKKVRKGGNQGQVDMVPLMKKSFEDVERSSPMVNAYDFVEGRGKFKDGLLTFYSSFSDTSGEDAVYTHPLNGQEFFECSQIGLTLDGKHFMIAIHVEWMCGTYMLSRINIWQVLEPVQTVRTDRVGPSFVLGGIIPSIASELALRAVTVEPGDKGSLSAYIEWASRLMILGLGHANYGNLLKYHKMLIKSSKRTAEKMLASRPSWKLMPGLGTISDMADKYKATEVAEKLGVADAAALHYVTLTKKSTRAEFWVNVSAAVLSAALWLWQQLKNAFAWIYGKGSATIALDENGLNIIFASIKSIKKIFPSVARSMNAAMSNIFGIQSVAVVIHKLQSLSYRYPRTRVVIEESLLVVECLTVAFAEEAIKRWTPAGFSLFFGAVEGLINGLPLLLEGPDKYVIMEVLAEVLVRSVAHLLLRLLPFPVATLIHAATNWVIARRQRNHWQTLLNEWELNIMELDLDLLPMSNPVNRMSETDLYVKAKDGREIPISASPLISQLDNTIVEFSPKHVMINSDATEAVVLATPSLTLCDMLNMYVMRMQVNVPYKSVPSFWERASVEFNAVYISAIIAVKGHFKVFTYDELRAYIQERPAYTKGRKEMLCNDVTAYEMHCKQKKKVHVGGKPKEVLPDQPSQAPTGMYATKTRPICPITPHGVMLMAVAVPFKNFLDGTFHFMWVESTKTFEHIMFPIEGVFVVSICYEPSPTQENLNRDIERVCHYYGISLLGHGDDGYVLYVDEHLEKLACETDAKSCDYTCDEPHQKEYVATGAYASGGSATHLLMEQFHALSGEQVLDVRGVKEKIYFKKPRKSTNTGEATTSTKAYFGQAVAFLQVVRLCMIDGIFQPGRYKGALEHTWKQLGLIPEWGVSKATPEEIWYSPDEVSFVGGYFFGLTSHFSPFFTWQSISTLKKYIVGPDVMSIYFPEADPNNNAARKQAVLQHMHVLTSDPDMRTNPVHLALYHFYLRCLAQNVCVADRMTSIKRYDAYLQSSDRWKFEMRNAVGQDMQEVDVTTYYDTVDRICQRHGMVRAAVNLKLFVSELDALSGIDVFPRVRSSTMALYLLRFGAPKSETKMQGLNFLSIVYSSGKKIISQLLMRKANSNKIEKKAEKTVKDAKSLKKMVSKGQSSKQPSGAVHVKTKQDKPVRQPKVDLRGHAQTLAYAHSVVAMGSRAESLPSELGVGESSASCRLFPYKSSFTMEANSAGFACACFEASGWIADPNVDAATPAFSCVGAPTFNETVTVDGRGVHGYYTTGAYVGVSPLATPVGSLPDQLPIAGTDVLTVPTLGLIPITLPGMFINGQIPVDGFSEYQGINDKATFTLNSMKATCEPDGYKVGSAGAVNVVSGTVMAWTYILGDDRFYNPVDFTSGSVVTWPQSSHDFITGLPDGVIDYEVQSVDKWPNGQKLHAHAVPNTQCAKGQWLPFFVDTAASSLTVNARVVSPQFGFIVQGAQPGQVFDVEFEINYSAYGTTSFEQDAGSSRRSPVDGNVFDDVLARTLPMHSKPRLLKTGKVSPAGGAAYAQTLNDTGTEKSAIPGLLKGAAAVAEAATGSSVGEILGDIAGVIGALLF